MERKVFLLGLLQSLSIFVFADPDINGTSMDNWIETEIASIEEYTRTLLTLEDPPTNAVSNSNESRENLSPFGASKTDWVRLHLLREALPRDSVVKKKFKHLFRLLLVAHDQANKISSSESSKSRYTAETSTTASVPVEEEESGRNIDESKSTTEDELFASSTKTTLIEISTGNASVNLDQETLSTSRSISNLITPRPNHTEDDIHSVTSKNISQHSTDRDDEEKTTIRTDIQNTESKEDKVVELSTLYDINVGSSTETVLKEAFDRPATYEEYSSAALSKASTAMQEQSSSSTSSGEGSERTNEEVDSISLQRSSTKTIPAEETTNVGEYTSAATVSTSVASRSQLSYSSSKENLATSTRAENNVRLESVTTNPKELHSSQEEYSSPRTLSYESIENTSSTSSLKEQFLVLTTEENLLVELTPAAIPVATSEKSSLTVTKIPSVVTKEAESSSSEAPSQSSSEVKLPTEVVSVSSIEEFLMTSSSTELYTDTNSRLTKNSTESSSIDTPRQDENIKLGNEFITSFKTTEVDQGVTSSTPQSSFTPGSSTGSTSSRHYVNERLTVAPVAKASDPSTEVHVNEDDTSKVVASKNTIDDHVQDKTASTTEDSEASRKAADNRSYVKNPLYAGSSRDNQIFRDIQHHSEDAGTDRSPQSEAIILYESGGNANRANVWRPYITRLPPIKNNIWRFDKSSDNSRPYGYRLPSPSPGGKANFVDESPSGLAKLLSSGRTNSLTPQKRGGANADIEKQFRWFYTRGQKELSSKSRSDGNDNKRITIQCKNTQ